MKESELIELLRRANQQLIDYDCLLAQNHLRKDALANLGYEIENVIQEFDQSNKPKEDLEEKFNLYIKKIGDNEAICVELKRFNLVLPSYSVDYGQLRALCEMLINMNRAADCEKGK